MLDQDKVKSLDAKLAAFSATKTSLPQKFIPASAARPPQTPLPDSCAPSVPSTLVPHCPEPDEGFRQLTPFLISKITDRVLHHLKELCAERGSELDFKYWKKRTINILSAPSADQPIIVPARAGSGKSTWLRAFLLALMELQSENPAVAESLGGVLIVIQKVEELNSIVALIQKHFPQSASDVIALQSWNQSGVRHGFCKKPDIEDFRECQREQCEYAGSCELLRFSRQAGQAFILGLTQARFHLLRKAGTLNQFLYRVVGLTCVPRRYLIFDEKFEFAEIEVLNKPLIDRASTELETLIALNRSTDRSIQHQQVSLSYHIDRVFQQLRQKQVLARSDRPIVDLPMGLCSLSDADSEQRRSYAEFRSRVFQNSGYATASLRACITVMDQLYNGAPCLFCKTNGFSVFSIEPPRLCYGESQTILFDATAEVDGDYLHLENARILPSCLPRHMGKLTFHIYSDPCLNVSKSAMQKRWKIEALSKMVGQILHDSEGDVFLCVYQTTAPSFMAVLQDLLKDSELSRIQLMPGPERSLPYFNGTNGSNCFNQCNNVILLGYPRLPPQTYLAAAYAAWGNHGFRTQFREACDQFCTMDTPQYFNVSNIPMAQKYQTLHLAARLEQEIYRCELRNYMCHSQIHVHLFVPYPELQRQLLARFPGSRLEEKSGVPQEVRACVDLDRSYKGNPTARVRLLAFLNSWDGSRIPTAALRERLDISPSIWKDLMQDYRIQEMFKERGIERAGRGLSACLMITHDRCA